MYGFCAGSVPYLTGRRSEGLWKSGRFRQTKQCYGSSNLIEPPVLVKNSGLVRPDVFFNGHVFELAGLKDVATFLAFNELSVFLARDNAHAGMPAGFLHR
jgi:hypothetical protein